MSRSAKTVTFSAISDIFFSFPFYVGFSKSVRPASCIVFEAGESRSRSDGDKTG